MADSKYNERRSECERALSNLQTKLDIKSLGELSEEEFEVNKGLIEIVDNLQTGHMDAVHKDTKFCKGDIRDKEFLRSVFKENNIEAVIHFAANSLVGVSMSEPLSYFDNNVY